MRALDLACRALGLDAIHSDFGFELALARLFLAAFLREAFLLLLQPGGIIALIGNAAAAIEFENPARDIVEKIAVMGDDQDRAGIGAQVALEPVDRLRVEMVGRLVEQQKLRLLKQQAAEGDAAALAAREFIDSGAVGRTAERLHRLIDLRIEIPKALGLDLVLERGHFIGGLIRIIHREFVVAVKDRLLLRNAEHHIAAHVELLVEDRLLRQIADLGALGDEALAGKLLVDPGHDPQKCRFAGAIDAEHANFRIRIERKIDVLENLFSTGVGLGQTLHVIDELPRHEEPWSFRENISWGGFTRTGRGGPGRASKGALAFMLALDAGGMPSEIAAVYDTLSQAFPDATFDLQGRWPC